MRLSDLLAVLIFLPCSQLWAQSLGTAHSVAEELVTETQIRAARIKSLEERAHSYINGKPTLQGDLKSKSIFDQKGKLVEKQVSYLKYHYLYDSSGRLIRVNQFKADDKQAHAWEIYSYAGNRQDTVVIELFNREGGPYQRHRIYRNHEGKIVKKENEDLIGDTKSTWLFDYDTKGRNTTIRRVEIIYKEPSYIVHENPITVADTGENINNPPKYFLKLITTPKTMPDKIQVKLEYDRNSNLIKKVFDESDVIYTYNSKNQQIESLHFYKGKISSRSVFSYNAQGMLAEYVESYDGKTPVSQHTFKYDHYPAIQAR